jgi:hypothetical protein
MKPSLLLLVALAPCLLVACAGYGPQSLSTGAPRDSVVRSMGAPTARLPLPDGGERLEYARGPYGRHTYMLDFDREGRLLRWEQVLTEANFNTIQRGMEAAQVQALIGHSFDQRVVGWAEKQTVWGYRYETPFCQWFQVGINPQGQVVDTSYGPDPLCEEHDGNSL